MRRLLAALALVFVPQLAVAQSELISPRELWPLATAAADAGDFATANKRLDDVGAASRLLGIKRFPLYAESAASLARQANREELTELSSWAMAAAHRLDPDSPEVAFTAADLARDRREFGESATWMARGVGRVFRDYEAGTIARANLVVVAAIVIAATAAVFALMLFLAYRRPAAHDFREFLGERVSSGAGTVIGFALLFLPLFLWLSPLWLLLYWVVLFFGYATTRERITAATLLVLLALTPLMLHWASYRTTGIHGPIVKAAVAAQTKSYHPDAPRRIRELIDYLPEEAVLHLLVGNLDMQEANENSALAHFRRATELNDKLAGAYLNIGNIRFLHNDVPAAVVEYERAAQKDPRLAIAYYNHAVAAGERYNFGVQGAKLEMAKKYDRAGVERLLRRPSSQKVVTYTLPISDAWAEADRLATRGAAKELFANNARFVPHLAAVNPVTLGSIGALAAGITLWSRRRRSGFAGACIKCGRTFCNRCKSSRESATYCTQCIHIYLKRDGVSIDTKRAKLDEVQQHQASTVRNRKIVATLLPGMARVSDDTAPKSTIIFALFALFATIAVMTGRLAPIAAPAETVRLVTQIIAAVAAAIIWALAAIPVYRDRQNG